MGEDVEHRPLPSVRAEVFEGGTMSDCLIMAANWVMDRPVISVIGYINTYTEDLPSVTVVYEP